MDPILRMFIRQFVGVVLMALVPVVMITFLSIPFNLGGHPGETRTNAITGGQHMT